MIDRATVEKIKNTADIVEVVSDYVHLIRRGANYMGLCPFHNERTPSFSVNKQRNFCYCFSCKKGGSPLNFIMEKEGLTYHEALLHLAKKYGIEVVERELTDEEREKQSLRESMFVANEWAMHKMESDMVDTEEGRDIGLSYFTQRGVTDEAIKAFHLGYALDNGHSLVDAARKAGFNLEVLKTLGLVGTSQQGREYDKFRGRVIFPIMTLSGKVIAFGGRDLKGGLAKYINSPESEIYKKSNELYGIFQAKSSIIKENKCFLVEGYMDVIGMWQSGMKNVVASSGTALTPGQINLIHRFTENITLIYDGDNAGIKASLRGIDMLLSHKLNVKVLLLPDGDDPDSFARKHTPEEFKEYVEKHETDIIRYKAQVMLDMVKQDPQNRITAINSVVRSIANIPDPIARDVYVQECSMILNIPESTISKSVARERVKIVEEQKRSKIKSSLPEEPESTLDKNIKSGETPTIPDKTTKPDNKKDYNYAEPLEKNIIKYCIRYGFLPFCTFDVPVEGEQQPRVVTQNVLEFVAYELNENGIKFTNELYDRIFKILIDLQPEFERYIETKLKDVEKICDNMLREGRDKIRNADLSVVEINREEEKLHNQIQSFKETALRQYSRDFPAHVLGSHEDDDIRKLTLNLVFEKHNLSNIYLKDGNTELEIDRLNFLVGRAIDELKNEIVNHRIKELMTQFSEIIGKNRPEDEQKIQEELESLMALRAEIAKQIGERIICR